MTSPQELVTYIALPLVLSRTTSYLPLAYESAETVVLQRIVDGCSQVGSSD